MVDFKVWDFKKAAQSIGKKVLPYGLVVIEAFVPTMALADGNPFAAFNLGARSQAPAAQSSQYYGNDIPAPPPVAVGQKQRHYEPVVKQGRNVNRGHEDRRETRRYRQTREQLCEMTVLTFSGYETRVGPCPRGRHRRSLADQYLEHVNVGGRIGTKVGPNVETHHHRKFKMRGGDIRHLRRVNDMGIPKND